MKCKKLGKQEHGEMNFYRKKSVWEMTHITRKENFGPIFNRPRPTSGCGRCGYGFMPLA